MKISTLFYTLRQGIVNIFRNKLFSIASIATIAACLFLLGLIYTILYNVQYIVRNAEESVCMTVYFTDGTTLERMQAINDLIDSRDEVSRTEFVSADEAWDEFKEEYLHGAEDGFPENPLEGMDKINVYMNDVADQETLAVYVESVENVDHVNRSVAVADALTGVNRLIAYISAGVIIILLAVSIFLISNTVSIGISVRSEEINIMKYIGATDFFVRAPFVLEGVIIGLVGTLIPMGLIYGLYNTVMGYITERFSALSGLLGFLSVGEVFRFLLPLSLLVGVGIGFFGSLFTVRKHLRV